MIILTALDDNNGMMFNKRRQSQDKELRNYMISKFGKISMNEYSAKQFEDCDENCIVVDDDFCGKAEPGDYCFVENIDVSEYVDKIEEIHVFRWNRVYPFDMSFTIDLSEWNLEETYEFAGYSHEKITEEIYKREGNCEDNSEGNCENTCEDTSEGNCEDNSEGNCENTCEDTSEGNCEDTCENTSEGNCEDTCNVSE